MIAKLRGRWEHGTIRLSALILALILWFLAAGRPVKEISLDSRMILANLEAVRLGDDLVITEMPEAVNVHIQGPRLHVFVQRRSVRTYVDVSDLGPGRHGVAVQTDLPTGMRALSIDPADVIVVIDAID